jgi:hypothetical protein
MSCIPQFLNDPSRSSPVLDEWRRATARAEQLGLPEEVMDRVDDSILKWRTIDPKQTELHFERLFEEIAREYAPFVGDRDTFRAVLYRPILPLVQSSIPGFHASLNALVDRCVASFRRWSQEDAGGRQIPSSPVRAQAAEGPNRGVASQHVCQRRRAAVAAYMKDAELPDRQAVARRLKVSYSALNGMVNGDRKRYGEHTLSRVLDALKVSREEWEGMPPKSGPSQQLE